MKDINVSGGGGGDDGGSGNGGGGGRGKDESKGNGEGGSEDRDEKKMGGGMSMSQKLTLGYAALVGGNHSLHSSSFSRFSLMFSYLFQINRQ